MARKISSTPLPVLARPGEKSLVPVSPGLQHNTKPSRLWIWFSSLFVLGVIILGFVSFNALRWVKNVPISLNPAPATVPITTMNVERSAVYAGLNFTVKNAQYATTFADDGIHSGQAVVRLNMLVANKSTDQITVIYYDVARLLVPKLNPLSPTNVHLSVGPKAGTSETGWIDFSVPKDIQLDALKLQFGSTALNESLVTIPFRGTYDASRYDDRTSPQSLTIYYNFQGNVLTYHLTRVDIRFSYKGVQARAGQQIYVLNFGVDNPNGIDVQPGFGFDYVRFVLNSVDRPPFDNTLPFGFKAGATGVGGHVAYSAPAGLKAFTVGFLVQNGSAESDYDVTL